MIPRQIPSFFGFYAVLTDPVKGYDYCTRLFVDYEIAFVQLRMKDVPRSAVIETARKMRKITRGTVTRFIVNDNPEIARDVGADGVHLGQGDMSLCEAQKNVGKDAIIGLSTHSVQQVKNACELAPDYVGMGPVYSTPTKKSPDPVIGLAGLTEMLDQSTVPGVAIGGITLENLPLVLEAGARNFCMVRPLTTASDPEKVLKTILRIHKPFFGESPRT
jgi:thiamine-phosphate pyrophosphorylase